MTSIPQVLEWLILLTAVVSLGCGLLSKFLGWRKKS